MTSNVGVPNMQFHRTQQDAKSFVLDPIYTTCNRTDKLKK
jgi:hypothetical protein